MTVIPKKLITADMFGAGDLSMVRIDVDPEDIRPSPAAVARYFGGPDYQMTPETHQRVCRGIQQAVGMVQAVICYRAIPMDTIQEEYGIGLSEGRYADMLPDRWEDHARYVAVFIGTLGSALETMCRDLAKHNSIYQSLLQDAVGTAMLDAVGLICNDMIEMHAQQMGLFSGCRMGPGLNGLALENQTLIFDLLGDETAGVYLNEAFIMQPAKSISGFVIYSDSAQQKPKGSKCLQCAMKHCQFRSTREK
ncbi:vitamin B12 dependent-methionine synthase activation domain-containing protein [Thermodesulfobacteriota bacterium]